MRCRREPSVAHSDIRCIVLKATLLQNRDPEEAIHHRRKVNRCGSDQNRFSDLLHTLSLQALSYRSAEDEPMEWTRRAVILQVPHPGDCVSVVVLGRARRSGPSRMSFCARLPTPARDSRSCASQENPPGIPCPLTPAFLSSRPGSLALL